jgi:hypothetical protein
MWKRLPLRFRLFLPTLALIAASLLFGIFALQIFSPDQFENESEDAAALLRFIIAERIHLALISDWLVRFGGNVSIKENVVKKLAIALSTGLLFASLIAPAANAQTMGSEAAAHPRIVRAIENLQDAIAYLEAAPDNFGGHKAAAIQASRAAIGELRASLAFRAQQDRR